MRYYFPEKPLFRWFRQKGECTKLPVLSTITLDRAAPKSSGTAPAATAKAPALAQPEPRRNAGAHAFLDQMEAVHKAYKWLTVAPPPKPQAAMPTAAVSLADKPHRTVEPIDLQDMPATLESNGFKQISATLMRKWFTNPKYAVQTQAQKDCVFGAAFYPSGLVDASSLKHKDLLQHERARLAYEKLKTQEFLESKTARDALQRILRKTPAGTVDIDATLEFGGDLQKMHRKYAFVSITVGKQFPQNFEDIRVEDLEKSRNHTDDLELALGEFRWYAAIDRAHVFYNGRTTRRIQVQSVALYAMAPYGFDDLDNTLEYRGHFNKKHLALVSTGTWVNYPVYMGRDMYAKNAILQPAFNQDFRQWSDKHGQGGDILLFSERMRPFIQPIDVVVPLEPPPTDGLGGTGAVRARIASLAMKMEGSDQWAFSGLAGNALPFTNKCNQFVYEVANAAGAVVMAPNAGPLGQRAITASIWANRDEAIPGWRVLEAGEPAVPGDIAAIESPGHTSYTGHVAIVVGDRLSASATSDRVVVNNWGFRDGQAPTFRRWIGSESQ